MKNCTAYRRRKLIEELISSAFSLHDQKAKPGQLILRLNESDRDLLKSSTSADFSFIL